MVFVGPPSRAGSLPHWIGLFAVIVSGT